MSGIPATAITYLDGDATHPHGNGPKLIAHVCNDRGGWGAGFVLAVSRRWPYPEREYRAWAASGADDFALGNVRYTPIWHEQIIVANMIAQHGFGDGGPPIRYDALGDCLHKVGQYCLTRDTDVPWASVHMPRIGCGLAGGRWEDVEPVIDRELCQRGIAVTVYDYQPPR